MDYWILEKEQLNAYFHMCVLSLFHIRRHMQKPVRHRATMRILYDNMGTIADGKSAIYLNAGFSIEQFFTALIEACTLELPAGLFEKITDTKKLLVEVYHQPISHIVRYDIVQIPENYTNHFLHVVFAERDNFYEKEAALMEKMHTSMEYQITRELEINPLILMR